MKTVLEIGCGDGFGGALVAQRTGRLICTDINVGLLTDNAERMKSFGNIEYKYHDFREKPFPNKVNGIFLVDVIEHIYTDEEPAFLSNIIDSLVEHGVCLIGTPNKTSEQYASELSKEGHVNLKDHKTLMNIGEQYYHNNFLFGMNDEVVHTGFPQMAHFLWLVSIGPKRG